MHVELCFCTYSLRRVGVHIEDGASPDASIAFVLLFLCQLRLCISAGRGVIGGPLLTARARSRWGRRTVAANRGRCPAFLAIRTAVRRSRSDAGTGSTGSITCRGTERARAAQCTAAAGPDGCKGAAQRCHGAPLRRNAGRSGADRRGRGGGCRTAACRGC
jgi:hypothetical protein